MIGPVIALALLFFYSPVKTPVMVEGFCTLSVQIANRCMGLKEKNVWMRRDMEFLFGCSTRYLTSSLRLLVRYRVEHSKRNFTISKQFIALNFSVLFDN